MFVIVVILFYKFNFFNTYTKIYIKIKFRIKIDIFYVF